MNNNISIKNTYSSSFLRKISIRRDNPARTPGVAPFTNCSNFP